MIENDIDMKTLVLLSEDMIKELIPKIGHRAKLNSNLQQWKSVIQGMPSSNFVIVFFVIFFSIN